MQRSTIRTIRRIIGLAMILLGLFLLVNMYILGKPPKVGGPAIATMIAIFFVVRGALYLWMARTRIDPGITRAD